MVDTSTFIWATTTPERISKVASSALEPSDTIAEVSVISLSEIAIKQSKGKIQFPWQEVANGLEEFKLSVLPYTLLHARTFFSLPVHHTDPFDRMIIAQALAEQIPIVTSDDKFRLYKNLEVIW